MTEISNAKGCCLCSSATRQQHMSSCIGLNEPGNSTKWLRRRQHHLAIGLDGDAIEFARQELIDRIHGRPGRHHRLRIMFIRIEQAVWRRCGNPVRGLRHRTIARETGLFSGAITSALGHHASAVRDAGGVGECDVKSMLAFTRAIAHQCRRGTQANQTAPAGASPAARARAVRAIAIAVSEPHACAGAKPRNAASAISS